MCRLCCAAPLYLMHFLTRLLLMVTEKEQKTLADALEQLIDPCCDSSVSPILLYVHCLCSECREIHQKLCPPPLFLHHDDMSNTKTDVMFLMAMSSSFCAAAAGSVVCQCQLLNTMFLFHCVRPQSCFKSTMQSNFT